MDIETESFSSGIPTAGETVKSCGVTVNWNHRSKIYGLSAADKTMHRHREKSFMKMHKKSRKKAIRRILLFLVICFIVSKWVIKPQRDARLKEQLYQYMLEKANRLEVFESAIARNDGKTLNTCVYFVSEALRENDIPIPEGTCNTTQLIAELEKKRWRKDESYQDLEPGDIVFTTDATGSKYGKPTHCYIFMKWAEEGNYDHAYICDNQANDYDGKLYHIRNIRNPETINGAAKEAFAFFMKP